jgi:hypothetical protein
MADATILNALAGPVLAEECVLLEVTDGETYNSRLSTPLFALATANVDDDGEINCTISGRVVTINAAGMTDKKIALLVKGYL